MKQEIRIVKYDAQLKVEAYHFKGIMQKFPNHFHEYYVIGFIENGKRLLSCKSKEYIIEPGDLLLFKTSVYIYMVPVITVITSVLVLHERITGFAVTGIILTLVGLFISESKFLQNKHGD